MITFNVLTSKSGTNNAAKSGNRLATERQTQVQHNDLLDIRTMPGYDAAMKLPRLLRSPLLFALKKGAELRERQFPKYWDDRLPRREISQSSSWVGNVQYDPDTQTALIDLGGKLYTYPGVTPDGLARMLNSGSLGKFLNSKKPYTGQGF